MERETKKQMAERQAAHDDRNLSRALTPAERRDKKKKKLFDERQVRPRLCLAEGGFAWHFLAVEVRI